MTREEAIRILYSIDNDEMDEEFSEAYDMAIKALQAEPCEDAVSRKDIYFKLTNGAYPNETIEQFIDRLVKELEDMPPTTPAQRWIPVSERLPEERGMYIVTEKVFSVTDNEHAGGFNLMTEQAEFDNGKWRRASFYEVIAWMPLPRPYRAEMEGEDAEADS